MRDHTQWICVVIVINKNAPLLGVWSGWQLKTNPWVYCIGCKMRKAFQPEDYARDIPWRVHGGAWTTEARASYN